MRPQDASVPKLTTVAFNCRSVFLFVRRTESSLMPAELANSKCRDRSKKTLRLLGIRVTPVARRGCRHCLDLHQPHFVKELRTRLSCFFPSLRSDSLESCNFSSCVLTRKPLTHRKEKPPENDQKHARFNLVIRRQKTGRLILKRDVSPMFRFMPLSRGRGWRLVTPA